ncbi:DUF6209 family protein [Comamonas sp. JC664]|uniref:DUF6209 family protein n=1 Tax=Comamonas sp. JC664 TaxID=2801917 RepID=UPI00174AB635|nr:DUF6209 family protein [Comamonas sp. JC664]MBL0694897.1 hypothetical protein [Comamonas sp. JC664]GHG95136.1 hypothetical protein GCM10012319_58740 [Comamonas sp. KCTC 72670]
MKKSTWKSLALALPLLAACGGAPQQDAPVDSAPVETQQAPLTAPTATVSFHTGWTHAQHGAIVRGGQLVVDYNLYRMTDCHLSTYNGVQVWDTLAYVRFLPSGQLFSGSVKQATGGTTFEKKPFEVTVPSDATSVELWFLTAGRTCTQRYDSNYGQNYAFPVEAQAPSAVVWAGDWGGSLARDCEHRDGLADPIVIDSYVMERACKFVDADVYVPGVTDAATARPEYIHAQVEFSVDGAATQYKPLAFQGRVGNNYRYRWNLASEPLAYTPWSAYAFGFRYSTDGVSWYRIANGEGPSGGAARTLQRSF